MITLAVILGCIVVAELVLGAYAWTLLYAAKVSDGRGSGLRRLRDGDSDEG